MNLQGKNLKSISVDYLTVGTEISEDIFNFDRSTLLLAANTILTQARLDALKRANLGKRNITVSAVMYDRLISQSAPEAFEQEYVERNVGYPELKKKMGFLLGRVQVECRIVRMYTDILTNEIADKLSNIDTALILQCVNGTNAIDEYLFKHSLNVGIINGFIGKWLGMSKTDTELLISAGIMHDLGKTRIPSELLNAKRKLRFPEFEVMKMHPIYSWELISTDSSFPDPVKLAARHHHERMNGFGYPDKLSGNNIPLFAKITAVSDMYDAMVSTKSYDKAKSPFQVLAQMSQKRASDLDPTLVKLFTLKLPTELVNKPVLMSDGSTAIIRNVPPDDLENPIVDINGNQIKTNANFRVIRMIS